MASSLAEHLEALKVDDEGQPRNADCLHLFADRFSSLSIDHQAPADVEWPRPLVTRIPPADASAVSASLDALDLSAEERQGLRFVPFPLQHPSVQSFLTEPKTGVHIISLVATSPVRCYPIRTPALVLLLASGETPRPWKTCMTSTSAIQL